MAGKVCPVLSTGGELKDCIGDACIMYMESRANVPCAFAKMPRHIKNSIDTLSAQVQEIQVVMNMLANAKGN